MVAPPLWMSSFANSIATHIHSRDLLSPLGCHYQFVDNVWEITIFASRTEIIGGAQDGRVSHCCFTVDVKSILDQFSFVDSVAWQTQSLGSDDELGPHLSVEGICEEKQIWLRITAMAPDRFDAGRQAFVNQQRIEELW